MGESIIAAHKTLLQAINLTKRFGSLTANDRVSVSVEAGSVHAVLGENGAGKSTLMKMLYGVYKPDEGEIRIEGETVTLYPPAQARAKGIRMVFQDFRLVPALTVLDNIALSMSGERGLYSPKRLRAQIAELSARYGLAVEPDSYVWQLDLGQRQRVEIVKALLAPDTRVVIFDEPTSVLTPHEVESFLAMIGELKQDGYGIVLITHKINEVMASADKVTVLRQGKVTFSATRDEGFNEAQLVNTMMGAKALPVVKKQPIGRSEPRLTAENLCIMGDHGETAIQDVSFVLRKGEITGVAGISGNGQRELAETIFGLRQPSSGLLQYDGRDITGMTVRQRIELGMAFVSEDPVKQSVVPGFTIQEHMVIGGLPMAPKALGIDWNAVREQVDQSEDVRRLGLAELSRRADRLSGGNIQRMVLSRALLRAPELLIVSYPSRGLDIGTTKAVQSILAEIANLGTAVLLISEDLGELFELSDQLLVLSDKSLHGPYDPHATDAHSIGRVMLKGVSA